MNAPLDPTLAADRLDAAWGEAVDAFRAALAALPEADRPHAEAYVGQVFDGTRMFATGSVQDLLDDVIRTLRGEADPDDDYDAVASAGDPHRETPIGDLIDGSEW